MIGIAVIGCGYWGPNLIRNFSETPGARLVTVCDLDATRLARVKSRYPTVETTTSYGDALADARVDAVVVATPVSTHFELARQALEAGKHVLVEKPLTASAEQAERLIELAARRQCVLMVDHTFIYSGAVRKIKEFVDEGRLGKLYYYDSVRINLGLFQHDVNVLWDLAVHDLSIMDFILGQQPHAISATGSAHMEGHREDVAYLTCFFAGNLLAHFHVNWLSPVKIRRTLIGGDQQMAVFDDLEPSEKIKVYDRGVTVNDGGDSRMRLLVGYRTGDMWAPQIEGTEALAREARHFVECIVQQKTPVTDGQAGLRVVRILEAATASMAERGRLIELNNA